MATTPVLQRSSTPRVRRLLEGDGLLERMNSLQNEIARRAFQLFERNGFRMGEDLENWLRAESELLHPIQVELAEDEDRNELILRAELPGFTEKDVEVKTEPGRIYITGKLEEKKEEKKEKTLYSELRSREVFRSIELPEQIDPEKVQATMSHGVLELRMPRAETQKKVPVKVKAA
jgi:HSP20 family molecular chaperone IbpA